MHSILNEMNYGRIEGVLGLNKPIPSENKGFIHVLANDPEVDIWWGHKREIGYYYGEHRCFTTID